MRKQNELFFTGSRRFTIILGAGMLLSVFLIFMNYKMMEVSKFSVSYSYEQAKRLGRGINMGNFLEAPNEGEWGITLKEEYFDIIKKAHFDTIRVPIKWSAHAALEKPFKIDEAFFERIDWVIANAKKYGLNIVISFNNYNEMYSDPDKNSARLTGIWAQIASRYRLSDLSVYYEILNEPHEALNGDKWNSVLRDTIKAIRKTDTYHTLIVSGDLWGSAYGLSNLKLPDAEENLICTFHTYTPMIFTHQGVTYAEKEHAYIKDIVWPGPPGRKAVLPKELENNAEIKQWFDGYNSLPLMENPGGPSPVLWELDFAANWSKTNNRPVWLGEFGVTTNADMTSRINWLKFISTECKKREITWAYWDFCASCAAYDLKSNQWYEDILDALIY